MSFVPRLVVMMITVFLKSTTRPWPSVSRPSSRIWRSELKMSGCAFSISSKSTTLNGLRRTFSVSWPPSSKPTNPGGAPNRRETVCFSPYSLMSSEIRASSSSNRNSASALASSVLPTPVGPAKMNEPRGALRVLESGTGAADGLGENRDGLFLTDDALVQCLLHEDESARLLLGELEDGDAGGLRQHLGDQALVHRAGGPDVAGLPLLLEAQTLAEELLLLVAQARRPSRSPGPRSRFPCRRAPRRSSRRTRAAPAGRQDREAQAGAGLVDQVDRLVGQEAVGDVAVGEVRRGDDGAVGDRDLVERLVLVAQSLEDVDRVGQRRLVHLDGLEAALERGILLEVLAVLVERGRTDRLQLTAGEQRLEDARPRRSRPRRHRHRRGCGSRR